MGHGLGGRGGAVAGHDKPLADLSDEKLRKIAAAVNAWEIVPQGSEGYRTAEVTLGGVDTNALSSKTMESRDVPGLYFIGEVVDVTGHLGVVRPNPPWSEKPLHDIPDAETAAGDEEEDAE